MPQIRWISVVPTPVPMSLHEEWLPDDHPIEAAFAQQARHLSFTATMWARDYAIHARRAHVVFMVAHARGSRRHHPPDHRRRVIFPKSPGRLPSCVEAADSRDVDGTIGFLVFDEWGDLDDKARQESIIASWMHLAETVLGFRDDTLLEDLNDRLNASYGRVVWHSVEQQDRGSRVWVRLTAEVDLAGIARAYLEASRDQAVWERIGDDFPARADVAVLERAQRTLKLARGRLRFDPHTASAIWVMGTPVGMNDGNADREPFDVDLKVWAGGRDAIGDHPG